MGQSIKEILNCIAFNSGSLVGKVEDINKKVKEGLATPSDFEGEREIIDTIQRYLESVNEWLDKTENNYFTSDMSIIKHFVDEMNNVAKEEKLDFTFTQEMVNSAICKNHEQWFVEDLIPNFVYDNNPSESVEEVIDSSFDPGNIGDDLYEAFADVIETIEVDDEQIEKISNALTDAFNVAILALIPEDKQKLCDEFKDILIAYFNKLVKSYNAYLEEETAE